MLDGALRVANDLLRRLSPDGVQCVVLYRADGISQDIVMAGGAGIGQPYVQGTKVFELSREEMKALEQAESHTVSAYSAALLKPSLRKGWPL